MCVLHRPDPAFFYLAALSAKSVTLLKQREAHNLYPRLGRSLLLQGLTLKLCSLREINTCVLLIRREVDLEIIVATASSET